MVQNDFEVELSKAVVQVLHHEHSKSFINENPRFSHQGNYIESLDRIVRIVFRMDRPCIAILDDLFSREECEELINISLAKLKRSATIDPITGEEMVIEARTSWGTFFELNENDFIAKLDRRISEVMNWPMENGEGLQILIIRLAQNTCPISTIFQKQKQEVNHIWKKAANASVRLLCI
jgi:prolyl 4-hydroxylase